GEDLGLAPVKLGDSRKLRPGEVVLAVGTPHGLRGAVTVGVVSGVERTWPLPDGRRVEAVVAHVTLRPGNSGGPLVDVHGRVVGVNALAMGPRLGVAVPSHVVETLLGGPVLGIAGRLVALPPS